MNGPGPSCADVLIVREDDPRCAELENAGYAVVGYSWGANLHLDESSDLSALHDFARRVGPDVDTILELTAVDLEAVSTVERANARDYPTSEATRHDAPTAEHLLERCRCGNRFWGALVDGELIAVTCLERKGERWNTAFTSVLATFRGRGVGTAVKAHSIVTLFDEGARWFSTGGAVSNVASLAANRALGYALEPPWRTYSLSRE